MCYLQKKNHQQTSPQKTQVCKTPKNMPTFFILKQAEISLPPAPISHKKIFISVPNTLKIPSVQIRSLDGRDVINIQKGDFY